MKTIPGLLICVFVLSIFICGCKKKDETPSNHMMYDGMEYDLSHGIIENNGKWNGSAGYNLDVVLLSSGFIVHEAGGKIDSLSGIGNGIAFELYCNSSNIADVGEYIFDEKSNGEPWTFTYVDAVFNWSIEAGGGIESEAKSGTLSILNSGAEYEISMNLVMEDGKILTGFYKGVLKYYADESKSVKKEISWFY